MVWQHIKNGFRRIWEPSGILFGIFLSAWFFTMAVIGSLLLVGVVWIDMIYFLIASAIFVIFALLTLIRIKMQPKDTRLDILIEKVDALTTKVDNHLDKNTEQKLIIAMNELTQELQRQKRLNYDS